MTARHRGRRPVAPHEQIQLEVLRGINCKGLIMPLTRESWANNLRNAAMRCSSQTEVWHEDEFPPGIDPFSWEGFAWKITNGVPPRPETIAAKLVDGFDSAEPIPGVVRHYIADLLDGRVKQRRGPRKNTLRYILEAWMRAHVARRIDRLSERLKRRGVADNYHVAIEHVAARTGFSEHTLDSWVHPRQR